MLLTLPGTVVDATAKNIRGAVSHTSQDERSTASYMLSLSSKSNLQPSLTTKSSSKFIRIVTPDTWAEKSESFEQINLIRETNGNFHSCNSCKRLGLETKFLFVSRIEFIRLKLSRFSAYVSWVTDIKGAVGRNLRKLCRPLIFALLGGCLNPLPRSVFANSEENDGAQRRRLITCLIPMFLKTFVKISVLGHARSGHHVRSSDHTLQNFTIAPQLQCLREGYEIFWIW